MPGPVSFQNKPIQSLMFVLAALFIGVYAAALSISPVVRNQTGEAGYRWDHWLGFLVWLGAFIVLQQQTKRLLPKADPFLIPIVAVLSGWGLLTIWRLMPTFGARQTLWLAIAAAIVIAGLKLPNHLAFLRRYKYLWLTSGLLLTALTLLFGTNPATTAGPRLWLGCCGIYFQPSEPLKLLLIVYLAAYLADRLPLSNTLLPLLTPTLIMTGLTMLLLIAQRDLGTATIFLYLYTAVLYVATGKKRILLISVLTLVLAGIVGYLSFDIVRIRVEAWINPWVDPSGGSYQIVQSLIAVANGGLLGRGPGLGSPGFVPVQHSDFVFAAIAEETGLAGSLGLLLLYGLLINRGLVISLRSADGFRSYLAVGLTAYLVGQSILIIGGNLRMLPLTGVTLPFVAYGGSSLLTTFLALLILLHISHHTTNNPGLSVNWRSYLHLGSTLIAGLIILSLLAGYWSFYQSDRLLARMDNPRRALSDRYVQRGSLLDRHNTQLAATYGEPGSYTRQLLHPSFTHVIGFNHPVYGQSGLEASLDRYLRGLEGNPQEIIWWTNLLYGRPPPGLDVRLSLDTDLQRLIHDLFKDQTGAFVLLNASSGEILAMTSYPTFDPAQLDEIWADLIKDPRAPLLNRVTLGRYPPGAALGVLFLAATHNQGLPPLPESLSYQYDNLLLQCAVTPSQPDWGSSIAGGCPAAQLALGRLMGPEELLTFMEKLGLYDQVPVRLPTTRSTIPQKISDPEGAYLGLSNLQVSPLQMARAAAVLSTGGIRPAPRIAMSVKTPHLGWVKLTPPEEPVRVLEEGQVISAISSTITEPQPIWQNVAVVPTGPTSGITWYLAGTHPDWPGQPLTMVLLIEELNPQTATVIGRSILQAALKP